MDLDALIAKVTGKRQASKQQRPRQKRTKAAGFDLDTIVRSVTGQSPASGQIGALWKRVVAAEARHPDPRPSRALHALLKALPASQRSAVISERGVWLQRARERLPRQPPAATTLPPLTERRITRPDGQVVEIPAGLLTAIEPFAGAGLLSLALHVEGCVTVDLCDIDRWAIETQNRNGSAGGGFHHFGLGWVATPTDAKTWEPLRVPGNVDLLVGGPPCKWASRAARMGRRVLGPTAKDNYFPKALDWICDLQPRVVAFENSARIAKSREYRTWFQEVWRPQLEALGYTMTMPVLHAADYGTPQNRERAWVLCVPKGTQWLRDPQAKAAWSRGPQPTHGRPDSLAVQSGDLLPWVPMHDRLVSGCCAGYGLVDCVHLGNEWVACRTCHDGSNFFPAPNTTGSDGREVIAQRTVKKKKGPPISAAQYLMEFVTKEPGRPPRQPRYLKFAPADFAGVNEQSRKLMIGKRLTRYLSRAVVPHFSKMPEGLMVPPGLDEYGSIDNFSRKAAVQIVEGLELMSARDAAKLQDVPQWYAFEGPRSAVFTQIGMGVPVNMGRAVTRFIRSAMGMRLRAPWWETRDKWPLGLWPLDRLDPCMAFPGVIEGAPYSQEETMGDWLEILDIIAEPDEVDAAARRRRPSEALRPLSRQAEQSGRQQGRRLAEIFPDWGEIKMINAEALWRSGWRPSDATDAPYPFDDVYWFAQYVRERSRDATWYNFWALYYRRAFGVDTQVWGHPVARLWPLDPQLGLPEPFPSDAPFTARILARELRKQK